MPAQMEARAQNLHRISGAKLEQLGGGIAAEIEIVRVQVGKRLCAWRPIY